MSKPLEPLPIHEGLMWDPKATRHRCVKTPGFGKGYLEFLRPFLMSQRQALLMQVASIEETLGIEPTTADLRKSAKCDRMIDKEGG